MRAHLAFLVVATASSLALAAEPTTPAVSPEAAFMDVARVLQSPRCVNCHPSGDAPLQGDDQRAHAMGITRDIERVGLTFASASTDTSLG